MRDQASFSWLSNPEIFAVNRLPAHSDHFFYESKDEIYLEDMPLRQSLNGTWDFCYSEYPAERPRGFYQPGFDFSAFNHIQVPGHIQLQGFGTPQYVNTMYPWDGKEFLRPPEIPEHNPVGSYIKKFTISENLKNKRTILSFQGVESAFYVWLNGSFAGYSEDSFTPAEFDITRFLHDGENILAVEVYQFCSGSWLEDQDFWRFSGIWRDVYVYAVPESHVKDLQAKASLDAAYERGLISLEMKMEGKPCNVAVTLLDAEGRTVAGYKAESGDTLSINIDAGMVQSWSAEIPVLYRLIIELSGNDGTLLEIIPQSIGFRNIEIKNGLMLLNGRRIIFKGINRHEWNCRRGRSVTKEDMLWDIRFLKQHNINAVRTSHYPDHSYWYALCDAYGIYLIDETNLESHGSWMKLGKVDPSWTVPGSDPQWHNCVLDRAHSLLERDKNHPSVLIWSCGNESYAGTNIQVIADYFRRRDPSRLVHYEGVFHNREFNDASDMESRMYAKPKEIAAYLQANPAKPYISCEYSHAMGNSCGGLHLYTELEGIYEQYQGGFIWDYIDQSIDTGNGELRYGGDFYDRPTDYNFCTNGIVYGDRSPSPKVQEIKALFADVTIVVKDETVVVKNKGLFDSTGRCLFRYTLKKEAEVLWRHTFTVNAEAGTEKEIAIPLPPIKEAGEYIAEVSMVLKEGNPWADAGHERAFAQKIITVPGEAAAPRQNLRNWHIVRGDVNIGAIADTYQALFSIPEAGPVSLVYSGREHLVRAPRLSFWRAPTDNDRGAKFPHEAAQWKIAELYPVLSGVSFKEKNGTAEILYSFFLPTSPAARASVCYTAAASGKIFVRCNYSVGKGLPVMPLFGISFCLPDRYSNFRYYGLGPEEHYQDRKHGARLGVFEGSAAGNLSRYTVPQECGNRSGTRWAEITDSSGRGIRVSSLDAPFEFSVLPFSSHELENAMHINELPPVRYTWLRIAMAQTGVGGDDSWGAPVHEEFRLSSRDALNFGFAISEAGGAL